LASLPIELRLYPQVAFTRLDSLFPLVEVRHTWTWPCWAGQHTGAEGTLLRLCSSQSCLVPKLWNSHGNRAWHRNGAFRTCRATNIDCSTSGVPRQLAVFTPDARLTIVGRSAITGRTGDNIVAASVTLCLLCQTPIQLLSAVSLTFCEFRRVSKQSTCIPRVKSHLPQ
jgi:hypothetical protein